MEIVEAVITGSFLVVFTFTVHLGLQVLRLRRL